jgi:hypothetical protein
VIIVNWNARDFLSECLRSLDDRVYAGPLEIIVVDNASSDGSSEMVRSQFPNVTLICNEDNLGFAKANNIGIRRSAGHYLALVNSDVRVFPNCITALIDHMESHRDIGISGPKIIGRDGELQQSCRGFPTLWNAFCRALALDTIMPNAEWANGYLQRHVQHDVCTPVDILSGCFWMVRRDALNEVGLLDEAFFIYGEDMDWCKRFWDAGWPAMFIPYGTSMHYGGASSSKAPVRFFIEMQRADFQYWEKHHSRAATRGYFAITLLYHGIRIVGYSLGSLNVSNAPNCLHKVRCSVACLKWIAAGRPNFIRAPAQSPEESISNPVETGA